MKNIDKWQETKFLSSKGKVAPNPKQVGAGSLYIANLIARLYTKIMPEHCSGRLLDLGCGFVPFYSYYKNFVQETYCVDWENSLHKNIYLDQSADLNRPLHLVQKDFDCILLSDVFEHILSPDTLWASIAKHIGPNGKVIINVPFFYWIHEAPHDYCRYTKFYFERKSEEFGFEILQLEAIGGLNDILVDLFTKTMASIPLVGKPSSRLFYLLFSLLSTSYIWKKMSKISSKKFPLGYVLVLKTKNQSL